MRIAVHAVGRMKAGPEAELAGRYFDRLAKIGPSVGLEWAGLSETVESRAPGPGERKREEAARLTSVLEPGSVLLLLDERGKAQGSEDLARWIAKTRDEGCRRLVTALGGPDGHDAALPISPHLTARSDGVCRPSPQFPTKAGRTCARTRTMRYG